MRGIIGHSPRRHDGRTTGFRYRQAAESIFGYATAEVLNQPFTRLLSPMSEQAFVSPSGEPAVCVGTEPEGVRKGGEPFQLMLSVSEADTAHSHRCETFQGYCFSKPIAPEASTKLLQENLAHGAPTLPDFSHAFDLSFATRAANG